MDSDRFENLTQALAAFPFRLLQDFVTLMRYCKREEITLQEIVDYVVEVRQIFAEGGIDPSFRRTQAEVDMLKKLPKCEFCGLALRVEPVNNTRRRMVNDHSRSWWICPNPECDHEPVLSDRPPAEELERIGIVTLATAYRRKARRKSDKVRRMQAEQARLRKER